MEMKLKRRPKDDFKMLAMLRNDFIAAAATLGNISATNLKTLDALLIDAVKRLNVEQLARICRGAFPQAYSTDAPTRSLVERRTPASP